VKNRIPNEQSSTLRFLSIDDEPKITDLIALILLRAFNCKVLIDQAQTGEMAVLRLLEWEYDLILLDVFLLGVLYSAIPDKIARVYKEIPNKYWEGERLFRLLRTAPTDLGWKTDIRNVPVVFVGSLKGIGSDYLRSHGLVEFVAKPFGPKELILAVKRVLPREQSAMLK
jgi:CheY-like chemotaxis protein